MSVLICGSRHPKNQFDANLMIQDWIQKMPNGMVILNGGAAGIDSLVIAAVRLNPVNVVLDLRTVDDWSYPYRPITDGKTCLVFRPDYRAHGKNAPHVRNDHMLNLHPELVLCLWNGSSPGTKSVFEKAKRRGLDAHLRIT